MTNHIQFPGLGLTFTVNRVAFTIGSLNIYWYGLLIATGMGLAMVFAFWKAKEFGIDADRMVDVIFVGTLGGIVCARAYYVLFAPRPYTDFWDIVNIRDGGLAIYGGIIGAVAFGAVACRLRKVKVLPMLDLTAMGFLIGQAFGRWGNFTNQEAFGTNTNLPWGMYSESTRRYLLSVQQTLAQQNIVVDPAMPVHPTFLYESLWCALGFVLLFLFLKHRRYDGQITLMYVAWYGLERMVVEGLRTDSLFIGPFRVSQLLAGLSAAVAVALLLYFKRKGKGAASPSTLADAGEGGDYGQNN